MANTPVLEREYTNHEELLRADREHNSQISANYKRLINPEVHIDEALGRVSVAENVTAAEPVVMQNAPVSAPVAAPVSAPAAREYTYIAPEAASTPSYTADNGQKLYRAPSARTDSAIFRADSIINARAAVAPVNEYAPVAPVTAPQPAAAEQPVSSAMPVEDISLRLIRPVSSAQEDEEESEDLRPTQTTIQYKTKSGEITEDEGRIEVYGTQKHFAFTKKEKITAAVIFSVIVALFALIIINSVIISGINSDIASLQTSLVDAKANYSAVQEQIDDIFENGEQIAMEYAEENNMVKAENTERN